MVNFMKIRILPATPKFARAINNIAFKTWFVTYPNKEVGITVKDVIEYFKDKKSLLEKRKKH